MACADPVTDTQIKTARKTIVLLLQYFVGSLDRVTPTCFFVTLNARDIRLLHKRDRKNKERKNWREKKDQHVMRARKDT
jgi:hypothetical protein